MLPLLGEAVRVTRFCPEEGKTDLHADPRSSSLGRRGSPHSASAAWCDPDYLACAPIHALRECGVPLLAPSSFGQMVACCGATRRPLAWLSPATDLAIA